MTFTTNSGHTHYTLNIEYTKAKFTRVNHFTEETLEFYVPVELLNEYARDCLKAALAKMVGKVLP